MKGNGKAKYVLRGRITRLKPDTYGATAQAHHIVSPETAYVKGQKVIGTLQKENIDINANGEYKAPENVLYEGIKVNVPVPNGYVKPSGTQEITENGEHNIADKEKVNVNVPIPDGYILPNGTKEITEPGKHNVTNYEEVDVQIEVETLPLYDGTVIIEKAESETDTEGVSE